MVKVIEFLPFILQGVTVTILLSLLSMLLAVVLGLLGAWAKLARSRAANKVADIYTTLIRGIPDLVLMLLLYFGGQMIFNSIGKATGLWRYIEIDEFTAGVLSIGFIYGSYMTETFRGAVLAIPKGQIEAGISYGMEGPLLFRRIIWPQLVRYALPGFTNNWLTLMKTTALVSVIGLEDLVNNGYSAGRASHEPFAFMFVVLLIYLAMTAVSGAGLKMLDRRYSVGIRRA